MSMPTYIDGQENGMKNKMLFLAEWNVVFFVAPFWRHHASEIALSTEIFFCWKSVDESTMSSFLFFCYSTNLILHVCTSVGLAYCYYYFENIFRICNFQNYVFIIKAGTDVMIFKIFSPKNWRKNGIFDPKQS
jgi:hypothetical protein